MDPGEPILTALLVSAWACSGISDCELQCDDGVGAACAAFAQRLRDLPSAKRPDQSPPEEDFLEVVNGCYEDRETETCEVLDEWRGTVGPRSVYDIHLGVVAARRCAAGDQAACADVESAMVDGRLWGGTERAEAHRLRRCHSGAWGACTPSDPTPDQRAVLTELCRNPPAEVLPWLEGCQQVMHLQAEPSEVLEHLVSVATRACSAGQLEACRWHLDIRYTSETSTREHYHIARERSKDADPHLVQKCRSGDCLGALAWGLARERYYCGWQACKADATAFIADLCKAGESMACRRMPTSDLKACEQRGRPEACRRLALFRFDSQANPIKPSSPAVEARVAVDRVRRACALGSAKACALLDAGLDRLGSERCEGWNCPSAPSETSKTIERATQRACELGESSSCDSSWQALEIDRVKACHEGDPVACLWASHEGDVQNLVPLERSFLRAARRACSQGDQGACATYAYDRIRRFPIARQVAQTQLAACVEGTAAACEPFGHGGFIVYAPAWNLGSARLPQPRRSTVSLRYKLPRRQEALLEATEAAASRCSSGLVPSCRSQAMLASSLFQTCQLIGKGCEQSERATRTLCELIPSACDATEPGDAKTRCESGDATACRRAAWITGRYGPLCVAGDDQACTGAALLGDDEYAFEACSDGREQVCAFLETLETGDRRGE